MILTMNTNEVSFLIYLFIRQFPIFMLRKVFVILRVGVGFFIVSNNRYKYNTIQYNTIQYNTIQYNTIQYNTIQYNTISINGLT